MLSDTLTALVIGAYLGAAGDHAALYHGQIEPAFVQAAWTTHPYLDDEEFRMGDVCYDGNVYYAVPMRYNILDNQLAVVTPVGKLAVMPDQDKIRWFDLDGSHYVRVNGWFMQALYQGATASLLLQKQKAFAGDIVSERHYYHHMTLEERYYLLLADGTLHEVTGKRSLSKAVPEFRDELKQFVREYDLKFTGERQASSLCQCAQFLDGRGVRRAKGSGDTGKPGGNGYTEGSGKPGNSGAPRIPGPPGNSGDSGSSGGSDASQSQAHGGSAAFPQIPPLTRVAAYHAYAPDSQVKLEFTDDDIVIAHPGISEMSVLHEARTLEEVEVLGMHGKLSHQLSGVEAFRPALMRNVPLAMGEADVLKLALKLPGVSSTGEAASGINVRGGATEQTLMLYNGNTIFNPMHMFGLFSAFNPDLVAETELYKGGIPSEYGGRLSSVMNIKGRTPDRKEFHGSASVGLVTTKAMAEIPIVKDRASLLLGGRTTYSDWMLAKLPEKSGYRDGRAGYWDVGGTLSAGQVKVNAYYSRDHFALTQYQKYAYSNMNFSAEVRSHFGERLSTTVMAGYDHYDYANDDTELHYSAARLSFDLNQYFVKGIADYQLNDEHALNMGVQSQLYHIMPGSYQPLGEDSEIRGRRLANDNALESALWLEDTWTLSPELKLTGGLRLNLFNSLNAEHPLHSINPDLRISANYTLSDNASLKAGFNTLHQYLHKVSNTVIMSPTDTWVLSNSKIKPQSGWQLSAGYYLQSDNKVYELSAEAYYKGMNNYQTYRNAAILVMNDELERDVVGTRGRAYGLELQLRKLYGRLNGWLSYTYSRTQLRQTHSDYQVPINDGRWFAADYDAPHDVKLVGNFKFTRRYSTSLNVDYSTGRPFTAPVAQMPTEDGYDVIPIYSDRNTMRMPDYFRVDWSFNIEPSHHLTALTHSWFTIGVYNVLGRRNAYSVYFETEGNEIKGHQLSIFGAPIPYVNYNVRF